MSMILTIMTFDKQGCDDNDVTHMMMISYVSDSNGNY